MIIPFADSDRWLAIVRSYATTAYRLEQAKIYPADVRAGAMDAWLAGDTTPRPSTDWSRMVAAHMADGKRIERVRVFEDSPTTYQQWLRWASRKDVVAGEIHRYMNRSAADQLGLSADGGDWWLLDDERLVVFHFDGLNQSHVEVIDDTDRVAEAIRWWDLAVANSEAETYGLKEQAIA